MKPRPAKEKRGENRLAMLRAYIRCSTKKQLVLRQLDQLRAAGCERIYREKPRSAVSKKRPALMAVKNDLERGDTFVITSICRAFRSTIDAINFLDDVINRKGVIFLSLLDRIDTATPEGRRDYIKRAADAEYERLMISIRTRDGMAAKKRRGKKFGQKRKLNSKKVAWARKELHRKRNPKTIREVARQLRVCPRTVTRALRKV